MRRGQGPSPGLAQPRYRWCVAGLGCLTGLAGMIEVSQILDSFSRYFIWIWVYSDHCGVSGPFKSPCRDCSRFGSRSGRTGWGYSPDIDGVPKVVTGIFKGILLFFLLAGETLTRFSQCGSRSGQAFNKGQKTI